MINNQLKSFVVGSLLLTGFACSQSTDNMKVKEAPKDTSLMVQADSTAILEAKKKAAAEEKAKLPKPYDDKENAELKIAELVKQAKVENKNIMLQAGGNWCIWCLRFDKYVQTTPELKSVVDQNYIYYHLDRKSVV